MSKIYKIHLISLGCTKNLVDSEVMLGKLNKFEMTDAVEEADIIIINTCGFIDAAKQESVNTILDVDAQRKRDSLLIAAGCLTERYKEELAKEIPEIDILTGLGDFDKIAEMIEEKRSSFSDDVFLIDNEDRVITGSATHAYIKLSEGCNQSCSFCAIPNFRGKLKSRTIESTVKEIERLVKQGYFDFSFISQDSSSYLRDYGIKDGVEQLVDAVEKIEGVKSARILYLYPSTTTISLIEKIENSTLFENYFDMPIQHVSDSMFKIMKRGKGKEETLALVEKMRSTKNSWIRTSMIVGHPGESEEDFHEMIEYLKTGAFDMINVFQYSNEEDTASFEMEQIEESVVEERMDIINEVVEEIKQRAYSKLVGETINVVINGESDEHEFLISGKNLAWAPDIDPEILINESEIEGLKEGDLVKCQIREVIGHQLLGKVVVQ